MTLGPTSSNSQHVQLHTESLKERLCATRLKDQLNIDIARALQIGATVYDPVPNNNILVRDPRSGADIYIIGNKQAPGSPYQLRWVDLTAFEPALTQYLQSWDHVKRSSLVDIWFYDTAKGLLAKGSAERGWPNESGLNLTSTEVEIS